MLRAVPTSRQVAGPTLGRLLTAKGIRVTRQRVSVLEALSAEPHDATAQEIHARLRRGGERVGLATVYRTLALLSRRRVIDALAHRPGEMCYRLCGDGHHHHLVCSSCHKVVELVDCDVGSWLDAVSREHGFVAVDHELEVTGICADCAAYRSSSKRLV
jgi:Fur family ferric uptake transcriptional regulator